ncbi:MAG: hypothetical protein M3N47_06400 [Chloroflexota bacterium]|nr:hypothetical protein [Chloroflexota bacterium]
MKVDSAWPARRADAVRGRKLVSQPAGRVFKVPNATGKPGVLFPQRPLVLATSRTLLTRAANRYRPCFRYSR